MSRLTIAVEGHAGAPEAVVRLDGTGVEWRSLLPSYDASTAASLRWVLEDYPRLMRSESRRLAGVLAHARLSAFGQVLHAAVFGEDEARLRDLGVPLSELDLVLHDAKGLTRHWPWELMNHDGAAVVHFSRSFVRGMTSTDAAGTPRLAGAGPLRVLMVIARPSGARDVPFRTVASRVLRAVADKHVDVEVLRPPTLEALESRLVEARQRDEAFDVVHFDGHGGIIPGGRRGGLVFEKGAGGQWVTGARMAEALKAGGVPVLLLNACQSAHAPLAAPSNDDADAGDTPAAAAASLAEEAAGSVEVVAMSHLVHVNSAAHIVSDVYAMLVAHRDVADAVRFARRRWIDGEPAIDVEEGYAIVRHFGPAVERRGPPPEIAYPDMRGRRTPADPRLAAAFQSADDIVGADNSILVLEQGLRRSGLVELRGLRGSGKTALLLELGRWLVATRGAEPDAVHYVDLEHESLEAIANASGDAGRQVVLVDNARVIHGDPIRGLAAWDSTRIGSWREAIESLVDADAHVVVATCAPLPELDDAHRVSMLPLDLESLRELTAIQSGDEVTLPDLALLWTGGNPGAVAFMVDWARGGHLADAATTWQTLRDLGLGSFRQTPLPLPMDSPLVVSQPNAMFEPAFLAPWMVAQCPVRMVVDPGLVKSFSEMSLGASLAALAEPEAFRKFEQAGFLCRTEPRSFDVHPLATCFMLTPVQGGNASEQHWKVFSLLAQDAAQLKALQLTGERDLLLQEVSDRIDSKWWLPSLIQSWRYMGELAVNHLLYLRLGRNIRNRLLEAHLGDYWGLAFADMQQLFAAHPPEPGEDGHQARMQWISLQTLEARRHGDAAREIALAREAAELSSAENGTTMNDAYDAQMKLGRAETEPVRKRVAFELAIEIAGTDITRKAVAELELTRLLRTAPAIRDLARARDYGESALDRFRDLCKAGIVERTRIVETALSLSIVYLDLWRTQKDQPADAAERGEALCRESLQLATDNSHKANAAYNLGLWRLTLGDPAEAETLLLSALSAYDALDEPPHIQNRARYYRLQALQRLLDQGEDRSVEVRLLAVDLLPRLLADPQAPREWKIDTYQIGAALGAAGPARS